MITLVVPTYREAENLRPLVEAIHGALAPAGIEYEVLIVDDDSRDGSEELCAELAATHPVRILVRREGRDLSAAVLCGIRAARGEVAVVMDADLSHPPSAIPTIVERLLLGEADFAMGARYVPGATVHGGWSLLRRLNSWIPTLLSRPLTPLRDPMSGFFALRCADLPPSERLSPIGYKIGLEIFVKGGFTHPTEVPIHFSERLHGASKLSWREQIKFLRHLRRLYLYRYPRLARLVLFGFVGRAAAVQTTGARDRFARS